MLEIKNVMLSFGGLIATNNVSFEVKANTICGLIGPNGAGKTTLFNIISGVYKPDKGEITFMNKRLDGLPPYKVNQYGIARTYQSINLFHKMSVVDNIKVGMHSNIVSGLPSAIFRTKRQKDEERSVNERADELLEFAGLSKKKHHIASSLSYGEQRMLEIARGLASKPKLLLLDEPAAGMNTVEKAALVETMKKIQKMGVTIFIVEHDMKLMMGTADHICVLNYGSKIAEGPPSEIQCNPEVILAYLGGE
ncbi:MAG: ABC transporter ATP-binding protein [Christensenellales bacterium]